MFRRLWSVARILSTPNKCIKIRYTTDSTKPNTPVKPETHVKRERFPRTTKTDTPVKPEIPINPETPVKHERVPRPTRREDPKKKRITLINENSSLSIIDLTEAEEISKIKKLKLVKIVDYDTQTRRPLYKLMTPGEFLEGSMQMRAEKREAKNKFAIKGQKISTMNSKINVHDLETKINQICKWVDKSYEVKVVISGDSSKNEIVYSKIAESLSENSKIYQKVARASDLKFYVTPVAKSNDSDQNSEKVAESSDSKSL